MEPVFPREFRDWRLKWDPAAATLMAHAPDSPVAARTVALRTAN